MIHTQQIEESVNVSEYYTCDKCKFKQRTIVVFFNNNNKTQKKQVTCVNCNNKQTLIFKR